MDIRKLQRAIVDGLEDVKGQNIVVFNTEHLSPLFERVIIASGTSNRQTKALASSVRETVKGRGMQVMRTEGEDNGEWIIVDCGAAVVHLMQPAIRTYYHLEEIWGGKPVKLKVGTGETKLVKASEDASAPAAKKAAAKPLGPVGVAKAPARKAAAKTAPAKKAAPDKAPARKVATKKAPARVVTDKAVPASKTMTVGAVKKPAAKKPVAVKKTVGVKRAAPAKAATKTPAKPAAKPATRAVSKTAAKPVAKKAAKRA
jgi:ribosome-associated protein